MYLLDTNAWIDCLKRPSATVGQRLAAHTPNDICTCSIVRAELYFGTLRSKHPSARRAEVIALLAPYASFAFDDAAADCHAEIRKQLSDAGTIIGAADMLIAAIALSNNLIVVTHNTAEFGRIAGLAIEDWQVPLPPVA
jgi:tRNA(fMet)-specific endonuclease VapC